MIELTPLAIDKLQTMVQEKDSTFSSGIRIFEAEGGCCSNKSYGMSFEKDIKESDHVSQYESLKIIMDNDAYASLTEMSIDFVDEGVQQGFRIDVASEHKHKHEHEHGSCGCSHSGAHA